MCFIFNRTGVIKQSLLLGLQTTTEDLESHSCHHSIETAFNNCIYLINILIKYTFHVLFFVVDIYAC